MTPRQTFAIYCKTGVNVRNCSLTYEQVNEVFQLPCSIAREKLSKVNGAIVRKYPEHKGKWLGEEESLFHTYAMEQAKKAYADIPGQTGGCFVVFDAKKTFGKNLKQSYPGDKGGVKIPFNFGKSLQGNIRAAGEYSCLIYNHGIMSQIVEQ